MLLFRSAECGLYILDFIDDVTLRQTVQKALNRGEAYHRSISMPWLFAMLTPLTGIKRSKLKPNLILTEKYA
jgi:hypothetical protein